MQRTELAEAAKLRAALAAARQRDKILDQMGGILPGDWRSPYPSREDIERVAQTSTTPPDHLPGVDLNTVAQLELLENLKQFQEDLAFPVKAEPDWRFYCENPFFPTGDAVALYSMLRYIGPRKLVEVGSGFSSAVILDTNDRYLDSSIDCTFIDIEPDRLRSLLRPREEERLSVLTVPVQEVSVSVFESLQAGDIMFIDSSHVAKMGGDVNHLFFQVLPRLVEGVFIHFHDIFYPFEYPADWGERGWSRSEAYVLHAFLQHNREYEICLFNHYLRLFHREALQRTVPGLLPSGGSIWLRKGSASPA